MLALWGATGAALIALVGNEAVKALIPDNARQVFGDSIAPPVIEETAKGIALMIAVVASSVLIRDVGAGGLRGMTAGLICGAVVGIGFSFTEDFFYFVNHATSDGVRVGADIYLGAAGLLRSNGAAPPSLYSRVRCWDRGGDGQSAWLGRIGWPLAGLSIAIFMHAVNNGFVQLLLVLRHGLDQATAWVAGKPVPAAVEQTATTPTRSWSCSTTPTSSSFVRRPALASPDPPRRGRGARARRGVRADQSRGSGRSLRPRQPDPRATSSCYLSGQRDACDGPASTTGEVARLGTARLRARTGPGGSRLPGGGAPSADRGEGSCPRPGNGGGT